MQKRSPNLYGVMLTILLTATVAQALHHAHDHVHDLTCSFYVLEEMWLDNGLTEATIVRNRFVSDGYLESGYTRRCGQRHTFFAIRAPPISCNGKLSRNGGGAMCPVSLK